MRYMKRSTRAAIRPASCLVGLRVGRMPPDGPGAFFNASHATRCVADDVLPLHVPVLSQPLF